MIIPTLETKRLRLRAWQESDMAVYIAMCADPQVMRYVTGKPMTRQEAWRHGAYIIGHWQLRGYGHWALEHKESGEFIGRAGFFNPVDWPGFEIGWAIRRDYWRQGLAEEAARCAMAYGFEQLGRDSMISVIHPENHASIALAKKLGQRYQKDGEILGQAVSIYGLSKEDWQSEIEGVRPGV